MNLEELEVLKSIYSELEFDEESGLGQIDINVSFAEPKQILFHSLPPFEVSYLPPLQVSFQLTGLYPSKSPPTLRLECAWLSRERLEALTNSCNSLWHGDDVLYSVIDLLEASAERAFNDDVDTVLRLPDTFYATVSGHQQRAVRAAFEKLSYECEICLEWRPGAACVTMPCMTHVFCKDCLKDMFSLHIREGSLSSMRCPSCPVPRKSAESTNHMNTADLTYIHPLSGCIPLDLLRQILSDDEVVRYQMLARKQAIESMSDSTHCPRAHCTTVLARDPDEKLVICTQCEYAFCADCMRGWHGPTEPCSRLLFSSELGDLYLSLLNDPAKEKERQSLERLYGIKNLKRLLDELEDTKLADQWRLSNTQSCPGCRTFVEKSAGCNHISCTKCGCHFCFLCGDVLSKRNPYTHYSDKGLSCYGRLFEGLTGLEDGAAFVFD